MDNITQGVKFKRGPSSTIPEAKDPGSLLFETDTGNMYLDDTAESRVQIKDPTKLPLTGGTVTGQIIFNVSDKPPFQVKTDQQIDNLTSQYASQFKSDQTITFSGDASGSVQFNGSEAAEANLTVSHATSADSATSAESATKATQDANGNNIADTYATKSEVAAKSITWEFFE